VHDPDFGIGAKMTSDGADNRKGKDGISYPSLGKDNQDAPQPCPAEYSEYGMTHVQDSSISGMSRITAARSV